MVYRKPFLTAMVALVLCWMTGCGGGDEVQTVSVSGIVTLDGKPLEGALVRFEPTEGSPTAEGWSDSSGLTDAQGKFTLETGGGQSGAIVGKHRVTITTVDPDFEIDVSTETQEIPKGKGREKLPSRYNTKTELSFTVPPEGSSAANFDLKSK
jgi:hypothetical protein